MDEANADQPPERTEQSTTPSPSTLHNPGDVSSGANQNTNPPVTQIQIDPQEILDHIAAMPDPSQALLTLSQFWAYIPQGNPLEGLLFEHYRVLRQRQGNLESVLDTTAHWGQTYLSRRLSLLGTTCMYRYQQQGDEASMQGSIHAFQEAIPIIPDGQSDKPAVISNLANALIWRFERLGDISDLIESISLQKHAIAITPVDQPILSLRLRSLASGLRLRFQHRGQLSDLDDALSNIKRAIGMVSSTHPELPMYLNDLGTLLRQRFERLCSLVDIEDAILGQKRALALTPGLGPLAAEQLNDLGMSYSTRFSRLGDFGDLENALFFYQQSVLFSTDTDSSKPSRMNNLANTLGRRFETFGQISDLHKAVSYHELAASLISDRSPTKPIVLKSYAGNIIRRFRHFGSLEDADKAIAIQEHALSLSPTGHPERPSLLDALGVFLVSRFRVKDDTATLDRAILVQTQAVSLTSDDDPIKAAFLVNLGSSLMSRFERLGQTEDIERAIGYHREAIHATPNGHSGMANRLVNLASSLARKFQRFGEISDLDEAIAISRQAVSLTGEKHSDKPMWLHNLGSLLSTRFDRRGALVDIDEAISHQNRSIVLCASGHPDKPLWLNNLGKSLLSRFETIRDQTDIDQSIIHQRLAVSLTPESYSRMGMLLNNLGTTMRIRFERKLNQDIDEVISVYRRALSLAPVDHSDRPARLSNLGNSLSNRYQQLGDHEDLEAAILNYREAVDLTPRGHLQRPTWMSHLGAALAERFEFSENAADLDESLKIQTEAVSLVPDTDPEKSIMLYRLSVALISRVTKYPTSRPDVENLMNTIFHASRITAGSPEVRFHAIRNLARLAAQFNLEENHARIAYDLAIGLIPSLVWLGNPVTSRFRDMIQVGDFATEAAAATIKRGNYDQALEWLEAGRSIIWNQILQLRAPMEKLHAVDPALATRLQEVAHVLDNAGVNRSENSEASSNAEDITQIHHRMAEEWEILLERARNIPGFSNFLRPTGLSELKKTTRSGAVVIINVYEERCDALILLPNEKPGSHVYLDRFSKQKAEELKEQWFQSLRMTNSRERGFKVHRTDAVGATKFKSVLSTLWSDVVQPILNNMGYLESPQGELPRVTWCATGPLSFLPIHAAGCYEADKPQSRIYDYVVSSYTPTLTALLGDSLAPDEFRGILAVGQAATKGKSRLPGTVEEIDAIERQAVDMPFTRIEGENATVSTVLAAMNEYSWVHLACHASQDLNQPTASAFYLADGALSLATITKNPMKHAGLAFLSACQTAAGDERVSEEAAHLAAGMLMSGFPSVIATMWSVRDQDAPVVAEQVYARLLEGGKASSVNAARALHGAVKHLRESIGEDKFEAWVPYIHIGL